MAPVITSSKGDTPMTNVPSEMETNPAEKDIQALDPNTFAGQQVGAILVVKRIMTPPNIKNKPEVGDFVKIIKHDVRECAVRSFRTGKSSYIPWSSFFPLKIGERCTCTKALCRCETLGSESQLARREFSILANPATMYGQMPGTILVFKHRAQRVDDGSIMCDCEIGDHLELLEPVLSEESTYVRVQNLRTGGKGNILWMSVFPAGKREVCACYSEENWECHCVYEDFPASVKYIKEHP
ncbi:uncharacterized protein LY89DRAFT_684516 [Mollisia scopiformis]|uniref:Uncharacterized protein n=1 Tax=Mollisia scopiformis TaxID=149040 RepID=A0A194XBD5_MOLSC|nr:uncharacterized protein LY89DRAFT_684516 [Mollisia scopiformis]KUJ17473.1 hypothetical protein LY89DRAFT_684516 [Mollisia scopiformis]